MSNAQNSFENSALSSAVLRNLFLLRLKEAGEKKTGRLTEIQSELCLHEWNHFRFSTNDFYLTVLDCFELGLISLNFSGSVYCGRHAKITLTQYGQTFAQKVYEQYYIEDKGLI